MRQLCASATFFKRLSAVYEEGYQTLLEKFKDEDIARQNFHRFTIPEGCLWADIRVVAQNVGQKLNNALAQITKTDPSLEDVINRADFNKQDKLLQERLIRRIEHFSGLQLSNSDVSPDILGTIYKYLLNKFKEEAPKRAGEFKTPRSRQYDGRDSGSAKGI